MIHYQYATGILLFKLLSSLGGYGDGVVEVVAADGKVPACPPSVSVSGQRSHVQPIRERLIFVALVI